MTFSKVILNSFFWDFSSRIIKQFSGFFIGIILARILGPNDFGLVSISMLFISMFSYLISTGLFSSIIQRETIDDSHLSTVFYFNLASSLFLLLIVYFSAPFLSSFFQTSDIFITVLRILSLVFILSALTQVHEALLRKKMEFKKIAFASVISSVFGGIIGIYTAFAGWGVWSLLCQIICEKIGVVLSFWILSNWRPKLIFEFRKLKELWSYGFHMFLSSLLNNFISNLDSFYISKKFGIYELGLFNRAKTLNGFVARYSSESISSIMFPGLSQIQGDKERMLGIAIKSELIISFVTFGLLGWLYITSEGVITIVLGYKWSEILPIYKTLCLSGFAYPIGIAITSVLQAAGYSRIFLKLEFIKKTVSTLGMLVGFLFGMQGYLISLIITGIINLVISIYITSEYTKRPIIQQIKGIIPYPVISICSALIVFFINLRIESTIFLFILQSLLFVFLYIFFCSFFKTQAFKILSEKIGLRFKRILFKINKN